MAESNSLSVDIFLGRCFRITPPILHLIMFWTLLFSEEGCRQKTKVYFKYNLMVDQSVFTDACTFWIRKFSDTRFSSDYTHFHELIICVTTQQKKVLHVMYFKCCLHPRVQVELCNNVHSPGHQCNDRKKKKERTCAHC